MSTQIKVDRFGVGSIVVDGVDISLSVAPEFTVTNRSGRRPIVSVNLIGMGLELDADADVTISEKVAEALKALGWQPPSEGVGQ